MRIQPAVVVAEPLEARRHLSASLVKDINIVQSRAPNTGPFVSAGAVNYMSQDDGVGGFELWKTDGTAAGTVRIKDINPGAPDSSPLSLTMVGSTLFFVADDGVNGKELWKSDGTAAGTQLVKDIYAGSFGANPTELFSFNGALYFSASDGGSGGVAKLWKSDGTAAGTVQLNNASNPRNFANNNGTLYFLTSNELWKSNGTAAGTTMVTSFASAGIGGSVAMVAMGGFVYFTADSGSSGSELWKSDGTSLNTTLVKNLDGTSSSSVPSDFVASGGLVYFKTWFGPAGLWRTDGTTNGTFAIGTSTPQQFVDVGGTVICSIGNTLQKTTGTTLTVIKSGLTFGFTMGVVNGSLYFGADDGTGAGTELWKTNGATATLFKDVASGTASSSPGLITPLGAAGAFVFTATDPTLGIAIYKSDGTAGGTTFVKDPYAATQNSAPTRFVPFNNALYFAAGDGVTGNEVDSELYKTDGTAAGTVLVKDIYAGANGSQPRGLISLGSKLFFQALESGTGFEPHVTDAATGTTTLIKDIYPGTNSSATSASPVVAIGNVAYFFARDNVNGNELWRSDGTANGTFRLSNFNPSAGTNSPRDMVVLNGAVYFLVSSSGSGGTNLWRSDGTVNGTVAVTTGMSITTDDLTVFKGKLYFSAFTLSTGYELWSSNGTTAGTALFKDIDATGSNSSSPGYFIVNGSTMMFGARTAATGYELYKTDGTPAGTTLVKDINPGSGDGFQPNQVKGAVATNGVAYFSGNDGANGLELWRSDGTAAGTFTLKDINTYFMASSGVKEMLAANGFVYFVANDGNDHHGWEVWRTDGTSAGTLMLADLLANFSGSALEPSDLTLFNGNVYFRATDELHGTELFRADPPIFATMSGNVLTISGTGGDDTIDVSLAGSTYTITLNGLTQALSATGVSSLVINGLTGNDLLTTNDASARPITFNGAQGDNTIDVRSGVATVNADVGAANQITRVLVRAGASARFGSTQHLEQLQIDNGGSSSVTLGTQSVLSIRALDIGTTGKLDLTDNDLIVRNRPRSTIESYVRTAYHFGDWLGAGGIFSSTARTNPASNTTLGLLSGAEFANNNGGTFNSQTVAASDVLVKYTYFGDVDFNGSVDVSDYNLIDFGFSNHLTGWANGDADWSGGATDVSDYNLVDFAFATQGGIL